MSPSPAVFRLTAKDKIHQLSYSLVFHHLITFLYLIIFKLMCYYKPEHYLLFPETLGTRVKPVDLRRLLRGMSKEVAFFLGVCSSLWNRKLLSLGVYSSLLRRDKSENNN